MVGNTVGWSASKAQVDIAIAAGLLVAVLAVEDGDAQCHLLCVQLLAIEKGQVCKLGSGRQSKGGDLGSCQKCEARLGGWVLTHIAQGKRMAAVWVLVSHLEMCRLFCRGGLLGERQVSIPDHTWLV